MLPGWPPPRPKRGMSRLRHCNPSRDLPIWRIVRINAQLELFPQPGPVAVMPIEPVYTVDEVANMLKMSKDTARRRFRKEPGVFVMTTPACKYKRRYETIRIPESVLQRVYRRCLVVAA